MQFCRDLAESGADFADQFDRNSDKFHGGITTEVPLGGGRVPETMGGAGLADWRALPEAPLAIEEPFGPEYDAAMASHTRLNDAKKAISVLNKPVEMAMKLRVQYKDSEGESRTAFESRLKSAERVRDGALQATAEIVKTMTKGDVSERTLESVESVVERGLFKFEDHETFGEYMQVLQRANQAIFRDQKMLLERIKAIKKAAKATYVVAAPTATEAVGDGKSQATEAVDCEPKSTP